MVALISSPLIFLSMLLILFVVSMFIVFYILREDAKYKDIDALIKQEIAAREESEKNVVNLQQEAEKFKKELLLKEELYQGLKAQYEELERDFERLTAQSQPTEAGLTKKEGPSASKPSIVDLLKSLNNTEKT